MSFNRSTAVFARFTVLVGLPIVFAAATGFADSVFVSEAGNSTIEEFNSVNDADLGTFANTGLSGPYGLTLDGGGNLYAANFGNNTVEKFTPNGVGSLFATPSASPVTDLACDSQGNIYVAIYHNVIEKYTPQGVGSVFATNGLSQPWGLTLDHSGNLYAANAANNTIEKFTPGGVGSLFASTGTNGPFGLATDASGNIYAAIYYSNIIEKFTPQGVESVFASTGLDGPYGLACDSAGNVYAANILNGTVEKFTPSGVGSVFASGLNSPAFLAIEVPEPSTVSLLALSAAGLVSIASRRGVRHPTGNLKP